MYGKICKPFILPMLLQIDTFIGKSRKLLLWKHEKYYIKVK